ncbi:MAG TPA: glutamate--tRNA ligase [Candidatus Paceibacterota bacterium]|nr:glutamate--tRNA ligase [Candidatus Paceibacterota bacterium]
MDDPKIPQSLFGPRVRLAPSPTGLFHLGNARTGLFNYLFARKAGGKFVLRIEDTDKERSKKEYENTILEGLKFLGIEWDEGPGTNGFLGPYRQSERLEIYEKYLRQLLEEEKAYYCFCSSEEIEAQKEEMIARGVPPKYSGKCRDLSKSTLETYLEEGKEVTIRIKMPNKVIKFEDIIRGEVEFDLSLIGDIVIAKSLKEPLYNFAVVIDDYLMKITHVIRGEDHISNTPKQIAIQEALGLPRPNYAHLPMILGPDRSKLSKRHGAMALTDYRKMGYLPEAIINFLVFLGWHPIGNEEILSLEELINKFDLERVQKGGAIFNIKRLDWFNAQYLKKMSSEELMDRVVDYIKNFSPAPEIIKEYGIDYIKKVIDIELPRMNKLSDLIDLSDFFFKKKIEYPIELLKWKDMTDTELTKSLQDSLNILEKIKESEFNRINLQIKFYSFIDEDLNYEGNKGKLLWPLRAALSGKKASPGPFEIAEVLGKEESIKRLKQAL